MPRVLIAIVIGVLAGSFLPESRALLTFNEIFSQFLGFFIPILIVGLVTPSIAEIGSGAGRMLAFTALLAYTSTVVAGFVSYFTGATFFPSMIDALKIASYGCAEVYLLLCVELLLVNVADSDELYGEAFVFKNIVAVLVRLRYSAKAEKSKFNFSHNKLLLILAINVEL